MPTMRDQTYEKLSHVEDWDEEMDKEQDERVIDVEYGAWILMAFGCAASLIIGLSVMKLIHICSDISSASQSLAPRPSGGAMSSPPRNIETCTRLPPSYENPCGNAPNRPPTAVAPPETRFSRDQWPTFDDNITPTSGHGDFTQSFPVVSLAFFLLSLMWCSLKRMLGSFDFSGHTRMLLMVSTAVAVVSLVTTTKGAGLDAGSGQFMIWQALSDETLFTEWVTDGGTVALNGALWWYFKHWEVQNSWEARDRRKQSRLEQLYKWEVGEPY